jgi:hypothetical protein|tara:strand:- start:1407 stop:2111 length:705 start_codon:yes stop_codon:yes gene_type:complete
MINTKLMNKLKKIVFFTLTLAFSFNGYSQAAAVATDMDVSATLLQVMTLAKVNDQLNFGVIKHLDETEQSVTILTTTASMAESVSSSKLFRLFTGTNTAGTSTIATALPSRASYTITGSPGHSYTVNLSAASLTLQRQKGDGTPDASTTVNQMTVDDFTMFAQNSDDAVDVGIEKSFSVGNLKATLTGGMAVASSTAFAGSALLTFGATLNIGEKQKGGLYKLDNGLTITVDYE